MFRRAALLNQLAPAENMYLSPSVARAILALLVGV